MSALSDYAENAVLEHIVGKTAFALPDIAVALYTTAPTDSTSGVEVSGGSYVRLETSGADWTAASNGSISNAVDFEWPTATAGWGSVTSAALVDGSDNIIAYGEATSPKVIDAQDTYRVPAGSFTLTLS